jgi:N-acetylneuraminic acid mutarotase
VAAIGNTAYEVGGYNGSAFLDTIIAWSPGRAPRVVGHLPAGLRYAAVAAADGRLIIAGGTLTSGLTDQILSFDPRAGTVAPLGHLPVPLTHASAVFVDGRVLVVGGRRQLDGDQTTAILAVNPRTGAVNIAARLPQPLSDAAVALSTGRVIVAGGDDGSGPQSSILSLTPRS